MLSFDVTSRIRSARMAISILNLSYRTELFHWRFSCSSFASSAWIIVHISCLLARLFRVWAHTQCSKVLFTLDLISLYLTNYLTFYHVCQRLSIKMKTINKLSKTLHAFSYRDDPGTWMAPSMHAVKVIPFSLITEVFSCHCNYFKQIVAPSHRLTYA